MDVPDNPDAPTALPRARASAELGEQFAALLKVEFSHQLGVCGQLGIPYRTYKDWMAEEHPTNDGIAAFRRVVMAALDERRRADLAEAQRAVDAAPGTHAATVWNMRKFAHESRFRRFYGDDAAASKVELTGKGGGPIETQLSGLPAKELLELYARARRDAEDGDG
jgi:hypothetical protein